METNNILILVNRNESELYKHLSEFSNSLLSVSVMDFPTFYRLNTRMTDEYSMVFIVINKWSEILYSMIHLRGVKSGKVIHISNLNLRSSVKKISSNRIYCLLGEEIQTITKIVKAVNKLVENQSDYYDFINLVTGKEVLCQSSCDVNQDDAFVHVEAAYKRYKRYKLRLFDIEGEITLTGVDDICSLFEVEDNEKFFFNATYEKKESVDTLMMWEM